MPHAVVIKVTFSGDGDREEGQRMLDEVVVPLAKAQPGFRSGLWMRDGTDGMGVVVFDTDANASAAGEVLGLRPA